jgi:hypothetical protein
MLLAGCLLDSLSLPEDGGSAFLRKVAKPAYTASNPRMIFIINLETT